MSNVVPGVLLTPEQENTAFHRRWDEFRNVVNISYSTPEDDATVTVYDVSGAGPGDGPPGLWCPLRCAGVPLESWQDYPEGKREAIRRGFMHGLCNMIKMTPPATLADWQYFRPEICKPVIYDRYFNPLNEQAHRTGDYATGRREIEKWLTTIYAAGVQIPFHPNFENELTAHLGRVPLTGVDAFLAGFAQRKGLATPEGYTYLLNVAIPLAEAPEAGRRTVMERVVSWLRLALDTPTAPATTKPLDTLAAFWEALRRIPMLVEWENDSPRYTVPVRLLGCEEFNEDLRPLREAFEAALPKLKTKHLRLLHHDLSKLLGIDRQRFRRLEVLYNERNYALHFLPDNYPILRFEVAESGRGLASPWPWVNPSIWENFVVLMQYKQEVARAIYDKISAALDKPAYSFPATAPQLNSPTLDTAPPTAAAVWTSLLCKNVVYTLADFDGLLVSLGLLTDAASRTPTPDFKGSAVLGAVKALRERRYLRTTNNAKLARLLAERYGTEAANPHTVKRGTDQLPEPATPVYTRALALLPAP